MFVRSLSTTTMTVAIVVLVTIAILSRSPVETAAIVDENNSTKTYDHVECECAPSILWPISLTLLVVLLIAGASYLFWRYYWSVKHGKHLVLVTDLEKGSNDFAFDNPGFKEGSPIIAKKTSQDEKKTKWISFNENSVSVKLGNGKSQPAPYGSVSNSIGTVEEQKQQSSSPQTSTIDENKQQQQSPTSSGTNVVPLKSHDFTGLGFNICGNMRDGIFIKDLLHRGPALESGHIKPGDRIAAVRINFSHMVYEDAVAILSYASPYEVEVEIDQNSWLPGSLKSKTKSKASNHISHPFYRSQSFSDIQQIRKDDSSTNGKITSASVNAGSSLPTSPQTNPAILQLSNASERMPKYGGVKVLPDINPITNNSNNNNNNKKDLTETREHCLVLSIDEVDEAKPITTDTDVANVANVGNTIDFDEIDLSSEKSDHNTASKEENATNNVKSIIVKSLQNIKEKINNHIQRNTNDKKKEITKSNEKLVKDELSIKSQAVNSNINKRKAPLPPTVLDCNSDADNNSDGHCSLLSEIDKQVKKTADITNDNDSDKDINAEIHLEETSLHYRPTASSSNNSITSVDDNDESDRKTKAASLGDLSKITAPTESTTIAVLERAVSLELAETPQKKRRKAPMPPDEDALSDDLIYGKDAVCLSASPNIGGKLKKSSLFGTLEEALKRSSDDEDNDSVSVLSIPDDDSLISSTPLKVRKSYEIDLDRSSKINDHRDNHPPAADVFLDTIEDDTTVPPDLPKSPVPNILSYVTEITVINNDDKQTDDTLFVTALETASSTITEHDATVIRNDNNNKTNSDESTPNEFGHRDRITIDTLSGDNESSIRDNDRNHDRSTLLINGEDDDTEKNYEFNSKYQLKTTDDDGDTADDNSSIFVTNGGKFKSSPITATAAKTKVFTGNGNNSKIINSRIPVRANTEPNLKFSLLKVKEDHNNNNNNNNNSTASNKGKKVVGSGKLTTYENGTTERKLTSYSTHNLSAKKSLSPVRLNGSNNITR